MNLTQDPLTFWHWAFALMAPAAVYCVLAALAWLGEHENEPKWWNDNGESQ